MYIDYSRPDSIQQAATCQLAQFIDPRSYQLPYLQLGENIGDSYGYICFRLIDTLQAGANRNNLRLFLFNVMAVNGFQNPDFHNLLAKTVDLCDLAVLAFRLRGQVDRNQAIEKAIEAMVSFRATKLVNDVNFLVGFVPPEVLQNVNSVMNTFGSFVTDLENTVHRAQSARISMGRGQAQQPSYLNDSFQSHSAIHRPWAQHRQPEAPTQVKLSSADVGSWLTNKLLQSSQTTRKPVSMDGVVVETTATSGDNSTVVELASSTKLAPVQQENVKTETTESTESVVEKFTRSGQYPYDAVYDLNVFNKRYTQTDNIVKPMLSEISQVDRSAHLRRPVFAKKWTPTPLTSDANMKLRDAAQANGELKHPYLFINNLSTATSVADPATEWANISAELVNAKNKAVASGAAPRVVVELNCVRQVTPLLVTKSFIKDICSVIHVECWDEYAAFIDKLRLAAGDDVDNLKAIHELNQIFTKRYNRFLANEAGLRYGTVTDLREDIEESFDIIKRCFGQEVLSFVNTSSPQSAVSSGLVHDVDDPMYVLYLESNIANPDYDLGDKQFVFHISEIGMTLVDLTSAELRFEIPDPAVSAGIFERSGKIIFDLVKGIRAAHAESKTGCDRQLIMTKDGVQLELTTGAFNPEFQLIGLAK